MKTVKKVSVSDLEKVAKAQGVGSVEIVEWNGIEVQITPTISLTSMLEFVNSVVESCFADSGEYIPEVKDFAVRRNVLERYANFRLPVDVHKCYDLVYGTDAYGMVFGRLNEIQFNEICLAIDEKIQFKVDTMVDALRANIQNIIDGMNELQEHTKHMFDDMSEEDLKKISDALEQGGLSEEKLVAAYLDQTKENREEM